jgi:hypothetical protein
MTADVAVCRPKSKTASWRRLLAPGGPSATSADPLQAGQAMDFGQTTIAALGRLRWRRL